MGKAMLLKSSVTATASALAILALGAVPAAASTSVLKPLKSQVKHLGPVLAPYHAPAKIGGTWTPLKHPFPGAQSDTPLQLTDGTVMVHDFCTTNWYRLTPDINGSYINGTWSKALKMPGGYDPGYFASQVLADGRMVINGGEYSNGCNSSWTSKGAIYNPVTNKWAAVAVPQNVQNIGDAQSIVLPNGGYMLANALTSQELIGAFSGTTPTWTMTGTGKADRNDEEGWNFIGLGKILTVDASRGLGPKVNLTEIYDIATGTWSAGPKTPNILVDPHSSEVGPAVLIPNGPLFQVGGTPCDSSCPGHTASYNPLTNKWAAGPDIPKVDADLGDSSDGPAVLLPNGNVLIQTSPIFVSPSHFFEYNGKTLTRVSEPDAAPNMASFEGRLMALPTGQIFLSTDGQGPVEVYTTTYKTNPDWAPTIGSSPKQLKRGSVDNVISGTRFNGLTQSSGYGDDAQSYTNYPLVRITNTATKHVCYARTHDHSTMGINEPEQDTSTKFDVPATCEAGASTLQVVANGMASAAVKTKLK
jgi:hypothetical protein